MKKELYGNEAHKFADSIKELKVDVNNWLVYYFDKETKEFWLMDYPNSELQGGGPPRLTKMSEVPEEIRKLVD